MRMKTWLTSMPTLATVGLVLFLVLAVSSGLLMWGANFGKAMVHDQLAEQRITFPPLGSPGAHASAVPRPPAVRRPAGGQRPEGEGLRERVHRRAPR